MADVVPIRRLLIANRGEIARRVIRTAHGMGIATVAVYAEGDAEAPFVREADTAVALGGRTAAESYLDIDKVVSAGRRAGADAVHPGYGFLSENPAFAEAVIAAGMVWVGPAPAAIRALGDKLSAKRLLKPLGVPLLDAFELTETADAAAAAEAIGYPVLIKAAAGGGGRGMRVVELASGLAQAIESARREAAAAFGDGTVFLERWLTRSRHIEIQILGDQHGNLVHLFERECSIQRRHQKIIEEAPSPAVDAALRRQIGEAALTAARAVGYYSVGTVEFLLSGREFFFLEVNTRLQVEHPVTEAITGLDLVREQIRVAEGEALGYAQADLRIDGHAIEARLCAEDPARNFLPAPGTVRLWQPPTGGGVRTDSGIETGSTIGVEFDPMIAKVIVKAPTRREAASGLARALERTRIQGVANNRDFLVETLRTQAFLAGDTTTDFLERVQPAIRREVEEDTLHAAAIAAALAGRRARRLAATVQRTIAAGFRNSVMPAETVSYSYQEHTVALAYRTRRDGSVAVQIGERTHHVVERGAAVGDAVRFELDGRQFGFAVTAAGAERYVQGPGGGICLVELPRFPPPARAETHGGLVAPMPGTVTAVLVAENERVERGQLLLVLEAMKMEHRIDAPWAGTVTRLGVTKGEQVANGAVLVALERATP